MGRLLRRIRELDAAAVDLPRLWPDPSALSRAAARWLSELEPHLSSADGQAAKDVVHDTPALFANRPTVICHGDFGPQNVLVAGATVSGLLDLEDARIGDPLLDVAWWASLLRAHTPTAFTKSWSGFLDAAGVDRSEKGFDDRVFTLIVLRLLETADAFRRSAPSKYPSWAERLSQTLRWRGQVLV